MNHDYVELDFVVRNDFSPRYFTDAWFECPFCGLCQPRDIPGFVQQCDQCGKEV